MFAKMPRVSSFAMTSFDLRFSFSANSFTVTDSESWIDAGTGGRSGLGLDGGGGMSRPLARVRRDSRSAAGVARPGAGGRAVPGAGERPATPGEGAAVRGGIGPSRPTSPARGGAGGRVGGAVR